ncbi:hypothetical protein RN607_05455 [Demequina capsici]|uniref:Uncharacterized protein n=1 Tax=Demequina capsici TaxID=3075620 RepID=A0AA96FED4_9MICO|nr:hypothetical protein [Demequina sp. PMTSA13]WNM28448.1 hypothetical protein RN607_05455 [Demequina sp. PMTSA13]
MSKPVSWPKHRAKARGRRRARPARLRAGEHPYVAPMGEGLALAIARARGARDDRGGNYVDSVKITADRRIAWLALRNGDEVRVRRMDDDAVACTACGYQAVAVCEHARRFAKELAERERKAALRARPRIVSGEASKSVARLVRVGIGFVDTDEHSVRVRYDHRRWRCDVHGTTAEPECECTRAVAAALKVAS